MYARQQRNKAPVLAHVFLDYDNDGIFSEGDEPVEGVHLRAGSRKSKEESNSDGYVVVTGGTSLTDISIDEASLEDPYFKPAVRGYSTIPLPGTMPSFELPLLETGIVEGVVFYEGGERPVAGMNIQLVSTEGEVVMESETAFDGYYAFEFVLPGEYVVQADPKYEVFVPPETVTVTSEDLFVYGIDLFLLEQAEEVRVTSDENQVTGGESSGVVAQTQHHPTGTQPAPLSSDSNPAIVKHVRIGESPKKDRLILELSAAADYSITKSDDSRMVDVDLPNVSWEADGFPQGTTTVVIQGLEIQPLEGGGTRVRIMTGKALSVGDNGILPPSEKMGTGHLLYVDLLSE